MKHDVTASEWACRTAGEALSIGACQDAEELAKLVQLVYDLQPQRLLEVGSSNGGSFYAFAQAAPDGATLYSIDYGPLSPVGHKYATLDDLVRRTKPRQATKQLYGNSQSDEMRDALAGILDGAKVDFLFIDAGHMLPDVTRDHELYAPFVRDGGIVAFHDIVLPCPDEITEVGLYWEQIRPRMSEYWEWYTPGRFFGIGAYRAPLMSESPWSDVSDKAWRIARTSVQQHAAIQDEHELGQFLDLIEGAKVICELGTLRGGTFHALAWMAAPDALCISIDLPTPTEASGGGEAATLDDLKGMSQPGQTLIKIEGDTHDPAVLDKLKAVLDGRKINALFIDADHNYDAVKHDHEAFGPLVADGGIIGFHDINRSWEDQPGCAVDRYWQDLLAAGMGASEYHEFIHAQSYGIGAYRVCTSDV